jgi:hypothetical protein
MTNSNASTKKRASANQLVKARARRPAAAPQFASLPLVGNTSTHVENKAVTTKAGDAEKNKQLVAEGATLLSGTPSLNLATLLLRQVGAVQDFTCRGNPENAMKVAMDSLAAMKPSSFVEGMLASQMIQTSSAMAEFFQRAVHTDQPTDLVDRNVNRAVRLGQLFLDQTEALQKLRGQAGQQRVVVEHVHVEAGGQAIVGAVTGGGGTK